MVAMRDEEVLYSVYIQYSVYSNQNDMSFCYEICVWVIYNVCNRNDQAAHPRT